MIASLEKFFYDLKRSIWRWVGLFVLGFPLLSSAFQQSRPLDDAFQLTHPTYSLPDNPHPSLVELIAGLEAATKKTPNDADAWYQLGLAYAEYRQEDKAVPALQAAVKINPDNALMWTNLSCLLYRQPFDSTITEDAFRTSTRLDPTNLDALNDYAAFLRNRAMYDKARIVLDKAQVLFPNSKQLWNGLGLLNMYQAQYGEAESDFQKALKIDPTYGVAYVNLGYLQYSNRKYEEAIDLLVQGVCFLPNERFGWELLAASYKFGQKEAEGKVKLEKLLEAHPDATIGWRALGGLQSDTSAYADALASYKKAIDINPNYGDAWNGLGLTYVHMNELEQAEAVFTQAVKVDPINAEAWNNLGYRQLVRGDNDKAIGSFLLAIKAEPDHQQALVNLIQAYVNKGQKELAQETCDRLAVTHPEIAAEIRPLIK